MGGGPSTASEDTPALHLPRCPQLLGSHLGLRVSEPVRVMCVLQDTISSQTIFLLLSNKSSICSKWVKICLELLKRVKDGRINRLWITGKSFKNECGGCLMQPNQFVQNHGRQRWAEADKEQLGFVVLPWIMNFKKGCFCLSNFHLLPPSYVE